MSDATDNRFYREKQEPLASKEKVSEERLRNTRAWAWARLDSLSGACVIVDAIDELLERRAAHEPCPVHGDQACVRWYLNGAKGHCSEHDLHLYMVEGKALKDPAGMPPPHIHTPTQPPGTDEEGAIQESTRKEQEGLLNAVQTVWFRAGLLACRAYMAAFVEQGGDKNSADSIRANWWPSLGEDPGQPRKNTFQELTVGEYGEPGFRTKTREEVSASIEALPVAQVFLQAHCGWPEVHYSTATKCEGQP